MMSLRGRWNCLRPGQRCRQPQRQTNSEEHRTLNTCAHSKRIKPERRRSRRRRRKSGVRKRRSFAKSVRESMLATYLCRGCPRSLKQETQTQWRFNSGCPRGLGSRGVSGLKIHYGIFTTSSQPWRMRRPRLSSYRPSPERLSLVKTKLWREFK
eukprot:Rmarinus@m.20131